MNRKSWGAALRVLGLGTLLATPLLWGCNSETSLQKAAREAREHYQAADEDTLRAYIARNNITDYRRTESGLFVVDVVDGQGTALTAGKQVRVKYVGRFITNGGDNRFPIGSIFDNSSENHSVCGCAVFTVGSGAIAGFNEGLLLMRVGDRKQLLIPSGLAYGTTGQYISSSSTTLSIPPNSTLAFDVEILSVSE